jgi:hypothetical protein
LILEVITTIHIRPCIKTSSRFQLFPCQMSRSDLLHDLSTFYPGKLAVKTRRMKIGCGDSPHFPLFHADHLIGATCQPRQRENENLDPDCLAVVQRPQSFPRGVFGPMGSGSRPHARPKPAWRRLSSCPLFHLPKQAWTFKFTVEEMQRTNSKSG